jgi:uncharacterized protein (DUF58 family)
VSDARRGADRHPPRTPAPRPRRTSPPAPRSAPRPAKTVKPVERGYDLRWPGFVYVFTVVFIAIGGFNGQNNLLLWAFGLGVAGVVISGLLSGSALMGLSVERLPVGPADVGADTPVRYRVRSTSRIFPVFALTIREEAARGPARLRGAAAVVEHCGPGETVIAEGRLRGARHGEARLDRIVASTAFPFGLLRKRVVFSQPEPVLVLPATLPLRRGLLTRHAVAGRAAGERTERAGQGLEFFGVRDYVPGDPTRSIAWRRSAATGTLVVRTNTMESPKTLTIDLPAPPPGATPDEAERVLALARSAVESAAGNGWAVGLRALWAGVALPSAAEPGHAARLVEALARIDTEATAAAARSPGHPRGLLRVAWRRDDAGAISAGNLDAVIDASAVIPPELSPAATPRRRVLAGLRDWVAGRDAA